MDFSNFLFSTPLLSATPWVSPFAANRTYPPSANHNNTSTAAATTTEHQEDLLLSIQMVIHQQQAMQAQLNQMCLAMQKHQALQMQIIDLLHHSAPAMHNLATPPPPPPPPPPTPAPTPAAAATTGTPKARPQQQHSSSTPEQLQHQTERPQTPPSPPPFATAAFRQSPRKDPEAVEEVKAPAAHTYPEYHYEPLPPHHDAKKEQPEPQPFELSAAARRPVSPGIREVMKDVPRQRSRPSSVSSTSASHRTNQSTDAALGPTNVFTLHSAATRNAEYVPKAAQRFTDSEPQSTPDTSRDYSEERRSALQKRAQNRQKKAVEREEQSEIQSDGYLSYESREYFRTIGLAC